MTQTWEELHDEYSNENYPTFGGPFTDALDPWEWLSKNFEPPKRLVETKQTAVVFLISELIEKKLLALRYDKDNVMDEIVAKAKEMEKEQIIKASIDTAQYNENMTLDAALSIAKKYYNKTYNK
jgi:hypothetical protein